MSVTWQHGDAVFKAHLKRFSYTHLQDIKVLPCKTLIYETAQTARHQGSCLLFGTQPLSLLK